MSTNFNTVCNKDHKNYIAVKDLTDQHFPKPYREQRLLDLTRCIAALTVRIIVQNLSLARQPFWNNTSEEYPGYRCRGMSIPFTGSGRIGDVNKSEKGATLCPCKECEKGSSRNKEVWTIWIFTAKHVVYDSLEAGDAKCKLFYDFHDGTSKTMYGVKHVWSNLKGDLCLLSCVTCDKDLADILRSTIITFNILWKTIREDYKKDKNNKKAVRKYKDRIVIVVSHPHGGQKMVSIGPFVEKVETRIHFDKGWRITYKANTCSGSSGSPVYLFGQDWFRTEFVHSGTDKDVNYSSVWCPE